MATPKVRPIRPDGRATVLADNRNMKMARSAHAYVRGNTKQFHEWLEAQAPDSLPAGPAIWICGDCHLGNLGPIASVHGGVEIQIRDLDQTVIGNPAHDLIRLGLSLAMAARGSDLPGVTTAVMLEQLMAGYRAGLVGTPGEPDAALPAPVHLVMKDAIARLFEKKSVSRLATLLGSRDDDAPVAVLDAAY
jgi:uncharacterized protein (DUF2252 family)